MKALLVIGLSALNLMLQCMDTRNLPWPEGLAMTSHAFLQHPDVQKEYLELSKNDAPEVRVGLPQIIENNPILMTADGKKEDSGTAKVRATTIHKLFLKEPAVRTAYLKLISPEISQNDTSGKSHPLFSINSIEDLINADILIDEGKTLRLSNRAMADPEEFSMILEILGTEGAAKIIAIQASKNMLTHLSPNMFAAFSSLQKINLENNDILNAEHAFDNLPNLHSLHLSGNLLDTATRQYLENLKNHGRLRIEYQNRE